MKMSNEVTRYGEAAFRRVADDFQDEILVIFGENVSEDLVRLPPSSESFSKEDTSMSVDELIETHEDSEDYVRIPLDEVKSSLISRDI